MHVGFHTRNPEILGGGSGGGGGGSGERGRGGGPCLQATTAVCSDSKCKPPRVCPKFAQQVATSGVQASAEKVLDLRLL